MTTYLIRRVLLFVPTILGATFIIFMLMALSPISIVEALLPPTGEMLPAQREEREAYLNERYGLGQPPPVQYLRWLNNISPVGFHTWSYTDPEVMKQRQLRRQWSAQVRPQIEEQVRQDLASELQAIAGRENLSEGARISTQEAMINEEVRQRMAALEREQEFYPMSGDIRWDRVPLKAPDLGDSFVKGRRVSEIIIERLPITLLLNFLSLPLAVAIAVLTGIWSASHRGRWQDWGTGSVLLALYSVPVIWVGVMLIGFLANVQYVRWFPAAGTESITSDLMPFFPSWEGGEFQRGYLLDVLWHLALPVICMSYVQFAFLSKLTRTSLLETLGADYVRTARAKGLSPNVVLYRHALRNSLIPLITFLAALLPAIITGSIVVETIFTIDGMGRLVFEAVTQNDRELYLSVALIILLLKLTAYLIADIAYVIADPRVSYS